MPVIAVTEDPSPEPQTAEMLDEDGTYDTKEEVAMYLYQYGKLPSNFMTKNQARKKGWSSGALHLKVKGKCIGGDKYSNYEGLLPEKDGRVYYECDINTLHSKSRGPERIVYSNDGLIYYTPDHYESFELLYGEEMLQ
ncbi:MAG: ribonuclease [Solobacterium sp.]|nr:ribonuclease [Solobacterium sp.]